MIDGKELQAAIYETDNKLVALIKVAVDRGRRLDELLAESPREDIGVARAENATVHQMLMGLAERLRSRREIHAPRDCAAILAVATLGSEMAEKSFMRVVASK